MKTYCPMFWSLDQGIDYSAPILHLKDIVPSVGKRTFAFFDSHNRLIWTSENRVGIHPLWREGLPPLGSEAAPKPAPDFLRHSAPPGMPRNARKQWQSALPQRPRKRPTARL
ncbi:hypothetical protein DFS28_10216 [Pseudomonas sp. 478]|nr:hypothetical protein DFS28_10216 [Pseudomonas sp. 478]TCV55943.1 hypothetical protein EDB99_10216 [Pseudomonas sp. 460]